MKRLDWQVVLGVGLIALSCVLYVLEIEIFANPRDTLFYFFQDVAFVPIQVLLVSLIINKLLNLREKRSRLEKLNMVIGAFFSEVGTSLLTSFSDHDPRLEEIRGHLIVTNEWSEKEFERVSSTLKSHSYGVDIGKVDLEYLRTFLRERRDFLLRLIENPNLLEHESFTEMLLAVFHLVEELANRDDLQKLPETDLQHLTGDIKRAYTHLVHEWLSYMKHLKEHYPYLFSLAIRTNPFDQNVSAIVK